jgi:hypothetical protein
MNLAGDLENELKKLERYRNGIRRKAKRLQNIMYFLEYEIEKEHPDYLQEYKIDTSFYKADLELILKQKEIEDYKSELLTIAHSLSDICKSIGLKKDPFFRKYKIWLVFKK